MKKRMIRILVMMLSLVLLVGVIAACDQKEKTDPTGTGKKEYNIGYLVWSMAEEFHVDVYEGAKAKADEIGGIHLIAPDPAGDMQKEISLIEDMIQAEV
ncbi:MAG TPA: hypothetical protein VFD19_05065, partial [Clostridia bacterium]|nr:hypothetical protein [Clostridia bacterium]